MVTIGNFYIFKPMRYDIFHNNTKRYITTIYTPTHIWSLNADSLSAYDAYPSKPPLSTVIPRINIINTNTINALRPETNTQCGIF